MSVTGIITNGVVVLPPGISFPEGAEVKVEPLRLTPQDDPFLAAIENLAVPRLSCPDDLAANHDYYLHGHDRKQQPRRGRWIKSDEPTSPLTEEEAAADAKELAALAAQTTGLPADLSVNHDHYLHGLPKR